MADQYNIYKICKICDGTGIEKSIHIGNEQYEDITCRECQGEGHVLWGQMKEEEEE